jgi:hypothetical protein
MATTTKIKGLRLVLGATTKGVKNFNVDEKNVVQGIYEQKIWLDDHGVFVEWRDTGKALHLSLFPYSNVLEVIYEVEEKKEDKKNGQPVPSASK